MKTAKERFVEERIYEIDLSAFDDLGYSDSFDFFLTDTTKVKAQRKVGQIVEQRMRTLYLEATEIIERLSETEALPQKYTDPLTYIDTSKKTARSWRMFKNTGYFEADIVEMDAEETFFKLGCIDRYANDAVDNSIRESVFKTLEHLRRKAVVMIEAEINTVVSTIMLNEQIELASS